MHSRGSDRHVVQELRHGLPHWQGRQMLYVNWHRGAAPGSDPDVRAILEPPRAFVRDHAAVCMYDVYAAVVGADRSASAHCDIVIPGQSRPVQMRGCRLHLPDHGYLLLEFRYDELISVAKHDVCRRSAWSA